jgi:hypothetical protein
MTLHYVGGIALERARFAQTALSVGHHCKLYENLDELAAHPPRRGLIFLQDDPVVSAIPAGLEMT